MNALSIVAIGGLSLLFLSYFGGGLCDNSQPNGGALCFHGFRQLGLGQPLSGSNTFIPEPQATISRNLLVPKAPAAGCTFSGNKACFGSVCTTFNPSASTNTPSGKATLCARVKAKAAAQHSANIALAYVGSRISMG